ncbi:phenylacetate--CoA ligase family protein [Patescibacteria group bacterium]
MFKLLFHILNLKRAEKFSRNKIIQIREKRFKKLLKHALTHSKFYKEFYGKEGITLDKLDKVTVKDLPPINKKIVMENYDDLVCTPDLKKAELEQFIVDPNRKMDAYKKKYNIIHTSGSSGKVGIFVYGPRDWSILKALVITRVTKTPINLFNKAKLVFIGAVDGHYAGITLAHSAPKFLFKFLDISISDPLSEINKKIDKFKPHAISGYASGADLLAKEQLKNNIDINPNRIVCSGDALNKKMKESIKEAFGIEPTNFYAASESIGMAAECDKHESLHLFDDWHIFEVVDKDNNFVDIETPGRLLLTNLYNFTQPLIRYEMNDEIVVDKNRYKCECGWNFPIIKNIAGRSEEFLWFKKEDGGKEFIHPLVLVEFYVPGLQKFQFEQVERNHLKMKAIIEGNKDEILKACQERMKEILHTKKLENDVKLDVEVVDNIENDPKTGKFKLIIPLKA